MNKQADPGSTGFNSIVMGKIQFKQLEPGIELSPHVQTERMVRKVISLKVCLCFLSFSQTITLDFFWSNFLSNVLANLEQLVESPKI